jgi:hypothetical protein
MAEIERDTPVLAYADDVNVVGEKKRYHKERHRSFIRS